MKRQTSFFKPVLSALVIGFMLTACGEQEQAKQEEVYAIPVETTAVTQGHISSFYNTTATLEAPEEAGVTTRIAGLIEQLYVEEGDRVSKGQLLAKIDARRQQYELERSSAEVKIIEQELERLKKMTNREFVSADSLAKLEYNLKAAIAQRDLAQLQVTESEIRSPIDGVIATRYVKQGNMAKEFDQLFYVVSQDELYGIVHLPEQQLASLKLGQEALVQPNKRGEVFSASVLRISPVIDSDSGTFKVTLSIPNKAQKLKAGMYANVQLKYDTHTDVAVVPFNAIVNQDDVQTLYVVEDGKALRREVALGYREDNRVEIQSGIKVGEQIVVRGQHNLKDQSLVEVLSPLSLTAAK
ncbi:RND transporter MFP subunit [Shewanella mangrovi]|uniref:RND transporter MFP subunit n=1 Tax=Shewanella mangrovi TaxID=1515746 RepID=A0A094LUE7_9GAMM|nr:efflux RND transporter periplasmic adaptor subunit [Shewanella mangrovi]KFZ38823.1 RND transporter MFP subunit [Shewanella mangrovi]